MAVGFPKPDFHYDYNLNEEKTNFDQFFTERGVPAKRSNEVDLATWNIANLGLQERRDKDLQLIAHILSHFDIIAVQEVNADLDHFQKVMMILQQANFDMVITDKAGSQERLAVVYRTDVFRPRQLFGELDYNPSGKIVRGRYVIKPKKQSFSFEGRTIRMYFYNFNRNPFLSTWEVIGSSASFMLANVHIYFGDDSENSARFRNRVSEVYFLANWAREQQKTGKVESLYERNVVLIGDMNIPKMSSRNPVYRALKRRGMQPSKYSTEAGTTIQEFNTYDQIVFTNERLRVKPMGGQTAVVVDFDNFVFPDLWAQVEAGDRSREDFKGWTKFAISDHRPLFVRLRV